MTNFLLRRFVPDYQNTADPAVREKYGNLAGIVGIICNVPPKKTVYLSFVSSAEATKTEPAFSCVLS